MLGPRKETQREFGSTFLTFLIRSPVARAVDCHLASADQGGTRMGVRVAGLLPRATVIEGTVVAVLPRLCRSFDAVSTRLVEERTKGGGGACWARERWSVRQLQGQLVAAPVELDRDVLPPIRARRSRELSARRRGAGPHHRPCGTRWERVVVEP